MRRIKRVTSTGTGGLPTGLDFQRQHRQNAARCQPIRVAGLTITNALRQSKSRESLKNNKAIRGSGCFGFLFTFLKQGQLLMQEQILSGQRCTAAEESAAEPEQVLNDNLQGRDSLYNLLADALHVQLSHGYPTDFTASPNFCGTATVDDKHSSGDLFFSDFRQAPRSISSAATRL
jgi:hypothetical protein